MSFGVWYIARFPIKECVTKGNEKAIPRSKVELISIGNLVNV